MFHSIRQEFHDSENDTHGCYDTEKCYITGKRYDDMCLNKEEIAGAHGGCQNNTYRLCFPRFFD